MKPWLVLLLGLACAAPSRAADERAVALGARVKKSVCTIAADRRDETKVGIGTGFVISADGLVVTNLHVIGHGRPIEVHTSDGAAHEVREVVAFDRELDLAVLRVKGRDFRPLKLGDSDALKVGQEVLAVGNPQGFEFSVVTGTVSGRRTLEGVEMVQVAMPIETGNSGGPVVDMDGRVHGVITLKSAVTPNLGLAVTSKELKRLLARPSPVGMKAWTAIYAPDPAQWQPRFGARWRQKAGSLSVDGEGGGAGGRSLLVHQRPPPPLPYEIGAWVRLADEAGAAGLFFGGAGGTHYGFYASRGKLRLTKFAGPDLDDWTILAEVATPHWRPGDWNHLKVRVEEKRAIASVNDEEVASTADRSLSGTELGLIKFRETRAEFRGFELAPRLAPVRLAGDLVEKVTRLAAGALPIPAGALPPVPLLDALVPEAPGSVRALRERARALEREAASLKALARAVHERAVRTQLADLLAAPEGHADLVLAALLVARLDAEDLDVEPYRGVVDRLAAAVAERVKPDAKVSDRLDAILEVLFREQGFHGSYGGYHSRANAAMNQVLDDREGIAITLGILEMELARRQNVPLAAVLAPGRFLVALAPKGTPAKYLDPVDGRTVPMGEVEDSSPPLSARAVVVNLLRHLLSIAHMDSDRESMLRYLDALLELDPDAPDERWTRAAIHAQAGRLEPARRDLDWLIVHKPKGMDVTRVEEYRRALDREGSASGHETRKK